MLHVDDVFVDLLHENAERLAIIGNFAGAAEIAQLGKNQGKLKRLFLKWLFQKEVQLTFGVKAANKCT